MANSSNVTSNSTAAQILNARLFYMITLPLNLILLLNYAYMITMLIRKKIWVKKPFYSLFVTLGISDMTGLLCNMVTNNISNILVLNKRHMHPLCQWLFLLCEKLFVIAGIYSCVLLGLVCITRFVAVNSPIYYKNKSNPGIFVVRLSILVVILPSLVVNFAILPLNVYNNAEGDYFMVQNNIFAVSEQIKGLVLTAYGLLYPVIFGGIVPLILYPITGFKLISNNANINRKVELKYFYIGFSLSLVTMMTYSLWIIYYTMAESLGQIGMGILTRSGMIGFIVILSINPFLYWFFDEDIKKMVKPPWQVIKQGIVSKLHSSNIVSVVPMSHAANMQLHPQSSVRLR